MVRTIKHLKGFAARWSRQFHVWISLGSIVLMFHFAFTGFIIRHPDWFGLNDTDSRSLTAHLPDGFKKDPDRLDIVEAVRVSTGLRGAVSSYEPDETTGTVRIVLERPGERADVTVEPKAKGEVDGTIETSGFLSRFTALHTGERAGRFWGLVIDASAVALSIVSVTGLVMALLHPRMRRQAWIFGGAGLVVLAVVWLLFVP